MTASMTASLYYTDETHQSVCAYVATYSECGFVLFCIFPSIVPNRGEFSLVIFTVTCFTVCHVCGHTIFV